MVKTSAPFARRPTAFMSKEIWRAALVGETTVRVWSMTESGAPLATETHPRSALPEIPGPVVAAGLDVPTRSVPGKPLITTRHAGGLPQVAAIPMLRQESPTALTRGAETAIAGYLHETPGFDGVLLVLGSESCWAHISAEEVVSFQTFLTSRIARALEAPPPTLGGAFETALTETLSRPERLAQHVASAHVRTTGQIWAHAIGAEIASAKSYWLGQRVVVLADAEDGAPYAAALTLQCAMVERADLTGAYLAGFRIAWDSVRDHTST